MRKIAKRIFTPIDYSSPDKFFIGFCEALATAALISAGVIIASGAWIILIH